MDVLPTRKEETLDHVEAASSLPDKEVLSAAEDDDMSKEQQRSIMRRIDLRVTAVTGILYCISLVDRTNLGAASIAGYVLPPAPLSWSHITNGIFRLSKDLDLGINNRYNYVALLFFVPYIIFEFPGTILSRLIGPRWFLGGICFLWGVVLMCFGFVTNWTQLLGLRVLLGFFEAGLFPAIIYILSTWYTRCKSHEGDSAKPTGLTKT